MSSGDNRLQRAERRALQREDEKYLEAPLNLGPDPRSISAHVRHVARFCEVLFDEMRPLHKLAPQWGKLLEAAAILYDTGHYVSDTGHHKHSEYLVLHSELPGFTEREKKLTAMLCRFHRKSMPSVRHMAFQALPPDDRRGLMLMIPLLRLASALDISKEQRVEWIGCEARSGGVSLSVSGSVIDLELWAAGRAAEVFSQVYQAPLAIGRAQG